MMLPPSSSIPIVIPEKSFTFELVGQASMPVMSGKDARLTKVRFSILKILSGTTIHGPISRWVMFDLFLPFSRDFAERLIASFCMIVRNLEHKACHEGYKTRKASVMKGTPIISTQ